MYNRVTLLYSRDGHNIVNQLDFNLKMFKKKINGWFKQWTVTLLREEAVHLSLQIHHPVSFKDRHCLMHLSMTKFRFP